MKKGFHIPFSMKEDQIIELGEKLLKTHIYDFIEIKWPCNYIDFDCSSYIKGIKYLVSTYNVGASCHIPTNLDLGQTNIDMRNEVIRQIKLCIDYAKEMKVTILPVHPGTILTMDVPSTNETPVKQHLQEAGKKKKINARNLTVSLIQEVADYAEENGMIIAVENLLLPQEIAYGAYELNEIITLIDRVNVKALYDCGHAYRTNQDVGEFIDILGENLCHVHLNDNDGTCDLHLQLEDGNIEYNKIFEALNRIDYKGALIVETNYKDYTDLILSAQIIDKYLKKEG